MPRTRRYHELAFLIFVIGLLGCFGVADDPADPSAVDLGVEAEALSTDEPYFVRLHVIVTRNTNAADDGLMTAAQVSQMISTLNTVYANAPLQFQFDPASDYERVASTLLNEDFPRVGGVYNIVPSDQNPNVDAQNDRAALYPGKVVVYFRDYTPEMKNLDLTANFANYGEFLYGRMTKTTPAITVGHELGHYFNLAHTHFGDGDGLSDTPPDPGPGAFTNAGLDPCGPTGSVVVNNVRYTPARDNLMSYYGCPSMTYRISNQQASRVRATIASGLYGEIINQTNRYDAVFYKPATNKSQVASFGWELAHINNRNAEQVGLGRNMIALTSYSIGGGQRRYDAVWQADAPATSYINGWEQAHLVNQHNALTAQGYRLATLHSYMVTGGRRYDALWQRGAVPQIIDFGWERAHVVARANDLATQGYIITDLHSYDIGGGVRRYDVVYSKTNQSSSRIFGWRQDHVMNQNAALGTSWGLRALETYQQSTGVIRFDGIWEPTSRPHLPVLNYRQADLLKVFNSLRGQGYMLKTLRARSD